MLISVFTPTYRRHAQLLQAIRCVQAQTYDNFEHLVIADGHDAEVERIVASVGDPRVRYLCTPEHRGDWGHGPRNFAMWHCEGDAVVNLDDDNLMFPHYLATMAEALDRPGLNPTRRLGYAVCWVDRDRDRPLRPTLPPRFAKIDHLNFMVRRELIMRVGGWQSCYEADFKLIDAVAAISAGIVIEQTLGLYRCRDRERREVG